MLISRRARVRYGFADGLFALDGNVILADFRAAQEVAAAVNRVRRTSGDPAGTVRASDINAAGLLHELMHALMAAYRRLVNPEIWSQALAELEIDLGVDDVEGVLETFVEAFPSRSVRDGEMSPLDYLEGSSHGVPHREIVLEEILLLWLANINPALASLGDLFDDSELRRDTAYVSVMDHLQTFFSGRPGLAGEKGSTLISMLRGPVLAHPNSLAQQLEHIRTNWGLWLQDFVLRLLGGLDFLAEEHRPVFPPGPGPVEAPTYPPIEGEPPEAFSADLDWMPRVVMLAKNSHVWLAQLSEEYGLEIQTLDQVPDEELDRLARRGFTSVWLIGVWERSRASEKIKRWMGDTEAVASAYSLYDYVVAQTSADIRRSRTSNSVPGSVASAWPPTWCRTTSASTAVGSSSTRIGSSGCRTVHTRATASAVPTCVTTNGSVSTSRTATGITAMRRWSSSGSTTGPGSAATSTTATTAPRCRGTTRRSSTTASPRCARR